MIVKAKGRSDGAFQVTYSDGNVLTVPDDMGNRHRHELAEWAAAGGAIVEYVPPLLGVEDYKAAIVAHLDHAAQSRLYDNATSISTYVNSTNPVWATEATAFVAWRDGVWAYAYTELDKVASAQRPQPTIAGFIAELPAMTWPA